ncbi:O-methyltransferase [Oceanobacillus sp. CAU 1775]
MDEQIESYLEECLPAKDSWIKELEAYAIENNVPIMSSVSIDYMLNLIKIHKPKNILEIGTAIGYSALRMSEANPNANITTIEKDEIRYNEAISNITKQNKEKQITVHLGDALEVMDQLTIDDVTFDFIFIDAAKGKYQDFFELAHPLLCKGGIIVTDNVLFRGYVLQPELAPKRLRNMVKKIRNYNKSVSLHPEYITSIIPLGDGVMISYKKD